MKLIKRKTRKAIEKSVSKAIRKHGPKIATGLAAGLASSIATYISNDESGTSGGKRKKGKKGKLANLLPKEGIGKTLAKVPGVKQVGDLLPGGDSGKKKTPTHSGATKGSSSKKSGGKRAKKQTKP